MGRKRHIFVQVSDPILRSKAWEGFTQAMGEDPDVVMTRVRSPKQATDQVLEACKTILHGSYCVYLQWHLHRGNVEFGQVISLGTCRDSHNLARFVYSGFNSMILGEGVAQKLYSHYNEEEVERHPGMSDLTDLHKASGGKCVPVVFRPMAERNPKAGENFNDAGRMSIMGILLGRQCINYIKRSA